MKRAITGLILAAGLLGAARTAQAVDAEAGTSASNILTMQQGARPSGMGGAFVGVSDDINALYHNPAGFGFLVTSEFAATQYSGFSDFNISDFSIALPLGDVTTSNVRQLGTVALSIATLDYGDADAFDGSGARIGSLKGKDRAQVAGWGKALNDQVAIGALARFYQLEIFGSKANGTAVDAGILIKVIPGYLSAGLAASGLGATIKYVGKSEDPPTEYTGGLALTPFGEKLTLALDVGTAEDRSSLVRTGFEWRPVSALALRAGYDSGYDAGNGITVGAGIQLLDLEVGFFPIDKIALDYSITPTTDLDTVHRVAITGRIGTK